MPPKTLQAHVSDRKVEIRRSIEKIESDVQMGIPFLQRKAEEASERLEAGVGLTDDAQDDLICEIKKWQRSIARMNQRVSALRDELGDLDALTPGGILKDQRAREQLTAGARKGWGAVGTEPPSEESVRFKALGRPTELDPETGRPVYMGRGIEPFKTIAGGSIGLSRKQAKRQEAGERFDFVARMIARYPQDIVYNVTGLSKRQQAIFEKNNEDEVDFYRVQRS